MRWIYAFGQILKGLAPHQAAQRGKRKYLKVSRLIKRRSVANDACDADRILVNGRQAKASYQVKEGDILEIAFGQRTLKVEVTQVADNVSKSDAPAMYREII